METDKMSTASSVGAERRPLLHALVIERRILFGCTVLIGFCTFIWIAAVSSAKWFVISGGPHGTYLTSNRYLMWSDSGLWEICRHVFQPDANLTKVYTVVLPKVNATLLKPNATAIITNSTSSTTPWPPDRKNMTGVLIMKCTNYLANPVLDGNQALDRAYDFEVANYVRTMVSFGIIGLFVMAMGCGFSVYTFRNPRYMFKRLAAGIHFISTACTFVVVQVAMTTVDYYKKQVLIVYPPKAYHYYHISFFLGWFVVLVNFCATMSFLWYSRKRKGDKAATDELAMADEPTIIGR